MSAKDPIFVRTVAYALGLHLRNMQLDAHWIHAVGEDTLAPPKARWPIEVDPMLNVMIQDGRSEGCIVCIYAQPDRYMAQQVIPLVGMKFLCNKRQVGVYLPAIFDFLDALQDNPEKTLAGGEIGN